MIYALVLLVVVFFVAFPLAQSQRERALAERLKQARSAEEAMAIMNGGIRDSKHESDFFAKLRESYFFWLR